MTRFVAVAVAVFVVVVMVAARAADAQSPPTDIPIEQVVRTALFADHDPARREALKFLVERGKDDVVPALIQALRFVADGEGLILKSLQALAKAEIGRDWHDWMLWQEEHTEVMVFEGFDAFKADVMAWLDPNFRKFLFRGVKHEIRLEEIAWGGVMKDGIPALTNPKHIGAAEATYLVEDELVFGVEINGDARAYPFRMLDWHEMFNDVVGGVPVSLAYCTLCGSGILFDTMIEGREQPFVFGSSGFLFRSNKLMYDQQTLSLWNQFTGRPVVGELTGSGIELKVRPVMITSWQKWHARHPNTKVLSLFTGFTRDYRPGRPYGKYFSSPDLMFPALVPDKRLKPKDHVFVLRDGANEKAWAVTAFAGGKVINDAVGALNVVLVGDAATRTVRAYSREGRRFDAVVGDAESLVSDNQSWAITEDALVNQDGVRLSRLPGHIAYWFAWSGYKKDRPLRVE